MQRYQRTATPVTSQPVAQMIEVLRAAKPGDKLKIVFADKMFGGDLKGRVGMIMHFFSPSNGTLRLNEMPWYNLRSVMTSGRWSGFRTYVVAVHEGYDADEFIRRTIGREMLESVSATA